MAPGDARGDVGLGVDRMRAGQREQAPLAVDMRNDLAMADNDRRRGIGHLLAQHGRPARIGRIALLAMHDMGGDHRVAGLQTRRQGARDSETDDAFRARPDRFFQSAGEKLPIAAADHRHGP